MEEITIRISIDRERIDLDKLHARLLQAGAEDVVDVCEGAYTVYIECPRSWAIEVVTHVHEAS